MTDSKSKLAALRQKMNSKKSERPQLKALPAREVTPHRSATGGGSDVLNRLKAQMAERSQRKEEAKKGAPDPPSEPISDKPETTTATRPEKETETQVKPAAAAKPSPLKRPRNLITSTLGGGALPGEGGFPSLVESGAEVASVLEKGQAETPVADFFSSLPVDPDQSWPIASILPLSAEARALSLSWLTRAPDRLFSHRADLLEIHFQNGDYRMRGDLDPTWITGDNLLDFARAAKRKELGEKECLHFEMPGQAGFQNTRLFCAGDPDAILKRPEIVSRIASQSNLLIIAGREEDEWTDLFQECIDELIDPIDAILPVIFGKVETDEGTSWTQSIDSMRNCRILPTVSVHPGHLTPRAGKAMPEEARIDLANRTLSRRLQTGIDLITERQEKRERDIRKRQNDAERLQRQLDEQIKENGNAQKDLLDELRLKLDEEVGGIQDWTKQRNKRQFSPTGDATKFAEELSSQLTESHLVKVEAAAARRFELPKVVTEAIEDEVLTRLRNNVHSSIDEVKNRLKNYTGKVEERLTEFHQQSVSIETPDINEREVWNEIRQYCQMDTKIGVDLPKRDPLRMFMSGSRQFIMPISMILGGPLAQVIFMIFGGDRSLIKDNPTFVGLLVGLMVVGLIIFVRNARALDREKMTLSVEKMRETVRTKILREMERVEKEKLEMILTCVGRLKDEWQGNLKAWVDEAISASQERLGRESSKVKSASVILQKRVREVDQTRKEVEKLEARFRAAHG